VTLLQFMNVFLMHSWLASALPFTPTQNSNLLVSISSCANPDMLPISVMVDTCGKHLVGRADTPEVMSLAANR